MKNTSVKIRFDNLINTRDLGGIVTEEGKTIRPKRLLRSGALFSASERDKSVLLNDYRLKEVIDLRMESEIEEKPDCVLEGVNTTFCPLIDESYLGIARDEYSIEAWMKEYRESDDNPEDIFRDMYLRIAFEDRAVPYFRKIFDILLNNKEGSVLWHCSAGKDRVGITTMLVLSALGVDRQSIVNDYYLTEKLTRREIMKIKFLAPLRGYTGRLHKALVVLFSAKPRYIRCVMDEMDRQYGSVTGFLEKRIGITPEEIARLRSMYLR